jgi:hypothetical protein
MGVGRNLVWLRRPPAAAALAAFLLLLSGGVAGAQNLTYGEFKFGVLAHDVHFLGGKEHGVDLNPEIDTPSPIPDSLAAEVPWYLRWAVQPRFAIGGEANTDGYTNQVYFGASWKWELAGNLLRSGDALTFTYFFGPGFNDGDIVSHQPDRKSLGSHVLFREAVELGYRITPVYEVSVMVDHVSNGGLARFNQSINDVGLRLGVRF